MAKNKLSPMMEHYLGLKEKYNDCILFYRLGDFYEMFYEDAIKVSSMLDLTLTGRNCGLNERAPMCGVPFHAADMYIQKLVSMGEKVAICEQLTEASGGKELVDRDVIKIITAGTVTNSELIDEKSNNYIACCYVNNNDVALSWADITTGEFFTEDFSGKDSLSLLADLLVRVSPVEIIANSEAYDKFVESPLIVHGIIPKFSKTLDSNYNLSNAESVLKEQLNVLNLSAFNLDNKSACICSSGALISYVQETQKHAVKHINSIRYEKYYDYMILDSNAMRNLELVKTLRDGKKYGSLLWLLDKTKTSMGARKLQSWLLTPLADKSKIEYRLNGVESLYKNNLIRQGISDILTSVKDIGRLTGKISNENLSPKDCIALKNSLEVIPLIRFQLLGVESEFIKSVLDRLYELKDVVSLISSAIKEDAPNTTKDGNFINDGFNKELDQLRLLSKNSKDFIAELEAKEREATGIKNLKIGYNRVFGYYIEVTNSFKDYVPYHYRRRQTIANAERFETDELKELQIKILSSEDRSLRIENGIFIEIKEFLSNQIPKLMEISDAISDLDVIISFATVACKNSYVKPNIINCNESLKIVNGRHPVVENISKQRFVPNDCVLDNGENRTMVITGPNMAGKSTYMHQVALITLMAHIGSFVPADSANIPLTDRIFTRIGASDNLISDQSTFMVEMSETAKILLNATENSLVILDEIGRGTSTFDGLSIAWAVLEKITKDIKAKTLFATHYHELTELEGVLDGVKNYKVTVKELQGGIVFLRKIMRGGTNRSFGIEVAELAGVSKSVTDRAKQILKSLEKSGNKVKNNSINSNDYNDKQLSEVELIVKDIDVNNLSPMQAFNILLDLKEKVN